ncbi:hypothetical protein [Arthrobacter psychrolactophilus]
MTVATRATSVEAWVQSFTEANNQDPEIQAHGKYFTCYYLLDMETHTFVVRVVSGTIVQISVGLDPIEVPVPVRYPGQRPHLGRIWKTRPGSHVPRHLGRHFPAGHEAGRRCPCPDAKPALHHPPDRTAALHRRTRLDHRSS